MLCPQKLCYNAPEPSAEEALLFKIWKNQVTELCERKPGSATIPDTHRVLPSLLREFNDYLPQASPDEKKKICDLFLLLLERYPISPLLREWEPESLGKKSRKRINTFLEKITDPTILKQNQKKH